MKVSSLVYFWETLLLKDNTQFSHFRRGESETIHCRTGSTGLALR